MNFKKSKWIIVILFFSISIVDGNAQDSTYLKVHFLYGSKPKFKYRKTESRWFGGKLGGHVGLECDSGELLNFLPDGGVHIFSKEQDRNSIFVTHSEQRFYQILGGNGKSVKKTIFYIPISLNQKHLFDSIKNAYLSESPYDYAFFGMRCGSSTYEILAQIGLLEQYGLKKTRRRIFYPRRLRKRLFQKAKMNHWTIVKTEGSYKRRWEKD
ncbi:MAG: hypothetical protein R2852_01935 [Bacteroidia bacterium]